MRAQAAALCLLAHGDCGCNPLPPATSTRESARGAVLVLTEGVLAADRVCAEVAYERYDYTLAQHCAELYSTARASLVAAAASIDAWESGDNAAAVCATVKGAKAAQRLAGLLDGASGEVPPVLTDGLRLYASMGALACREEAAL